MKRQWLKDIKLGPRVYIWRLLMGYAGLVDGLIEVCTLGIVSCGLKLKTARQLAKARRKHDHHAQDS
jgi:hypothetical protein